MKLRRHKILKLRCRKKLSIIITFLILVTNVLSQQFQVVINGKVTDPNGDFIYEAKVTLVDENKREFKTSTDQNGNFSFPNLLEGLYTITIEKRGFAIYEIKEFKISKTPLKTINITLSI